MISVTKFSVGSLTGTKGFNLFGLRANDMAGRNPLIRTLLLMCLGFIAFSQTAHATVYYVDSSIGSDSWAGTAADPRTSSPRNGPWMSLARVQSQQLLPGDEVRLRCGRRWSETLRIDESGTSAAPIKVGAYPLPCYTPPMIDGAVPIRASNWAPEAGAVFKAALPANIVENGTLRQSVAAWRAWSSTGDSLVTLNPACTGGGGCLDLWTGTAQRTVISSANFELQGGAQYELRYSILAPVGTRLKATVRRAGPTDYRDLGTTVDFVGTGAWQTRTTIFTASNSTGNSRLDFDTVGSATRLYLRDVRLGRKAGKATQLLAGSRKIQIAHFPNFGFDARARDSVYLRNATDSNVTTTNTGTGSTYLTPGSDFVLPAGGAITPGLTLNIRSQNWNIDQRVISSFTAGRFNFQPQTRYQVMQGWGYFFTGAAWMVDSPDEWFHDESAGLLKVWMPDGANPGGRLAYSYLGVGINLESVRYLSVSGLSIRGTSIGVDADYSRDIAFSNLNIEDTEKVGISAVASQRVSVANSRFNRTGSDAISTCVSWGVNCGWKNSANENVITDAGVQRANGKVVSLPVPSFAAIYLGRDATITRNKIAYAGNFGIFALGISNVSDNSISDACLTLDDCAGVYGSLNASGSTFENNVVLNLPGNTRGTPIGGTRTVGLYVDDQAKDIVVRNNAVAGVDTGIHVHNAYNNTLEGNTLYGNRVSQIWMQEQSNVLRTNGDLYGNSVQQNVLFSTNENPAIQHDSVVDDTHDFASYDRNIYSALISPRIVNEKWTEGVATYTFPQWQSATVNGVPRLSDDLGRVVTLTGYTAFKSIGGNVVPNGNLSGGISGWNGWNQTPPLSRLTVEACAFGPCLRFVAGASESLLSSPNFAVVAGQWYRVTFDAATGTSGQVIAVVPRRGGGGTAGHESLLTGIPTFVGSTGWARYSFTFKSSRTVRVNDPVTHEAGARIDFQNISPGKVLRISNVEMVPLSPVDVGLKTAMLVNPNPSTPAEVNCPDPSGTTTTCLQYVRFTDTVPIVWPYHLEPLGREIVFTRDPTLIDTDRDGIPNSQDQCSSTLIGAAANSIGCAFVQRP